MNGTVMNIILSVKGLQNLNNFPDCDCDFTFFYSDTQSFQMKMNFSEFISPRVSRLRKNDPTINFLHFEYHLNDIHEYFTDDIILMIKSLSSGNSVDINQSQCFKLVVVSILLENLELFQLITDSSEMQINESNIDQYLNHLKNIYQFSHSTQYFNYNYIIDYIASHFYSIEKSDLFHLPRPILLSIISNSHLKLDTEDTLFSFILQIFNDENDENDDDDEETSINNFLEKVNFLRLSENNLREALNMIILDELGRELFIKITDCIRYYKNTVIDEDATRYCLKKLIFKPGEDPKVLNGIIRYLTKIAGGNVHERGVVTLSSSSIHNTYKNSNVKNACDLDDTRDESLFHSLEIPNSWLQYDFGQRKIRPTHYTIRCRPNPFDHSNPRDWILEGSNTGKEGEWKKLDERKGDLSFMISSGCQTFDIREELEPNETFRFLRITQNGLSTSDRNWFIINALEYYGDLYDL